MNSAPPVGLKICFFMIFGSARGPTSRGCHPLEVWAAKEDSPSSPPPPEHGTKRPQNRSTSLKIGANRAGSSKRTTSEPPEAELGRNQPKIQDPHPVKPSLFKSMVLNSSICFSVPWELVFSALSACTEDIRHWRQIAVIIAKCACDGMVLQRFVARRACLREPSDCGLSNKQKGPENG